MPKNIMVCLVENRPDFDKALCKGASWEIFFPTLTTGSKVTREQLATARSFCSACPIKAGCLEFGCRTDSVGIWGGEHLTEHTARKLRQKHGWSLQREIIFES